MASNMITSDELNQFSGLSVKKKLDSMELYLIGANGYKYNMQEVGARVFGDENYSYTVSLIHRCYNFAGQNSGKYKNGCKFEQTFDYRVTRKDIEAFIKKYPNGTFNQGITFEDFLKTRINSAKSAQLKPQKQTIPRQTQRVVQQHQRNIQQYNEQNYNYSNNNQMSNERVKPLMIGIGSISILLLLILLVTGGLFRHWIISLIVLFITIGAFGSLKEL